MAPIPPPSDERAHRSAHRVWRLCSSAAPIDGQIVFVQARLHVDHAVLENGDAVGGIFEFLLQRASKSARLSVTLAAVSTNALIWFMVD
jgi:hypothetical protein